MHVVELLRSNQPIFMVFQDAGRRIRYLHDVWAKVEELDAAAEEAKKAGQQAQAVELAKQAAEQLSKFEEGHEYTTFADRPDQWKMLRALDCEHRVVLPPGSAPAKQGSALGVDGTANQDSTLGVWASVPPAAPAVDPSSGVWAPLPPAAPAMNMLYMCRAKEYGQCSCGNYFPSKLWRNAAASGTARSIGSRCTWRTARPRHS